MRIAIVIATTGRPEILQQTLVRLERQTRKPDRTIVDGASPEDAPVGELPAGIEFVLTQKGLTVQRNHALNLLSTKVDVIAFIDDDYLPAQDFLAGVERLFREHPDIVAASGQLLADGFRSAGISFEEADALIAHYEQAASDAPYLIDDTGTYGCNMTIRVSAAPGLRFDENLPLYGWLEDTDFSARCGKYGRIVRTNHFAGVHLGAKAGRTSGVRLGYSQIATPLYLARKGTMAKDRAAKMAFKNIVANATKSIKPEPWIDRAGRLRGNASALADIVRGRSHPTRILEF